jgi:DNA-binding FadR family transcriptional regulator
VALSSAGAPSQEEDSTRSRPPTLRTNSIAVGSSVPLATLVRSSAEIALDAPRAPLDARSQPSPDLAAETYPMIAALEELAVRSLPSIEPELLDELRDANREFQRAGEAGDVFACMTANDSFHEALLRAGGNATLARTLRDLKTRIRLLDSQYFQSGTENSVREHEEIIEALRRGDLSRAAEVIRGQWVRWLPAWGASPADH